MAYCLTRSVVVGFDADRSTECRVVNTRRWHVRVGHLMFAVVGGLGATVALASETPWAPNAACAVAPRGDKGLLPPAMAALKSVDVAHRITRTFDGDVSPSNYHGRDAIISKRDFSAAVDISVKCMSDADIQQLLARLALSGFAAWYRVDGRDGWRRVLGGDHIHAVWAAGPLKSQLRRQVESWFVGKTGLVGNSSYTFWLPTDEQLRAVKTAFAQGV